MTASVTSTNNHLGGPWANHPCCDTQAIVQLHRAQKAPPGSSTAANADHVPDPGNLVVPPNWTGMDYACCLIALPLLPLGAIMYPLMWICFSPAFFLGKLYLALLRRPVKILQRSFIFNIFTALVFVVSLPGILLTLIYWLYFSIVVITGSLIVSILSCRIWRFSKNWEILKPHRKWPGWTWQDLVCGMMGAMDRQGYFEFLYRFPTVLLITPLLKYVFTTNPFIHNLAEEYCNQWSVPLELDDASALASVIMSLSWTAHTEADRKLIDRDRFAAHYPLAPVGRKVPSVVGVQFTNILINITKSTHNIDGTNRSKSGKRGIFIVELYFWNPCHMLTGYVEVNVQHIGGIEHPMWCVIGKNHWAVQFFKNVDNLFWSYAPSAASFFKGHAVVHPAQE